MLDCYSKEIWYYCEKYGKQNFDSYQNNLVCSRLNHENYLVRLKKIFIIKG